MEWTPPFTGVRLLPKSERAILPAYATEAAMKITTVGLDLAKNVFQVHGVDERGDAVVQVHGVGPWAINYVNPADDPRKK